MYDTMDGLAPDYLCNIMPPPVSERTEYNLRSVTDITVLNKRTEPYSKLCLPSYSYFDF